MNNQFDDLTKSLAQSVTRRAGLKKFGVGLAGMALACFGLANKSIGATFAGYCEVMSRPHSLTKGNKWMLTGYCISVDPATGVCAAGSTSGCPAGAYVGSGKLSACSGLYWSNVRCSFSS